MARSDRVAIGMIVVAAVLVGSYFTPLGGQTTAQDELPAVKMTIGEETFRIEVAATDMSRERGLMHRASMPNDRGMLFIFPNERQLGFWMKNTRIPLDIIYLNAAGVVVSVKPMKPHDESPVNSDKPAKYAIELNLGAAARAGIKAGDKVELSKEIREWKVE